VGTWFLDAYIYLPQAFGHVEHLIEEEDSFYDILHLFRDGEC
jgi:hypothetical protein